MRICGASGHYFGSLIKPLLRWTRRSNASAEGRVRGVLQFPLPAPARIAIVDNGFSQSRNTREFTLDDMAAIHQWAPQAIVAPLATALSLADQKLRGLADLASLRALIVLTEMGGDVLADDYRELLWQAFKVPIFEQLRSRQGPVIARECEVHDGLHVDPAARLNQEISEALVNEPCECGSETPRLRGYFMPRTAATRLSASASLTF
jgi:hypothetical protein